jgi:hypothetical protein
MYTYIYTYTYSRPVRVVEVRSFKAPLISPIEIKARIVIRINLISGATKLFLLFVIIAAAVAAVVLADGLYIYTYIYMYIYI